MDDPRHRIFMQLHVSLVSAFALGMALLLLAVPITAADKPSLIGDWTLNRDLTEERRPKVPKAKSSRSGFGSRVAVGAGGVLMPVPNNPASPSAAGATGNLPQILACQQLSVTQQGSDIVVTCPQMLEPRNFAVGRIHGRTVKWSNRKLTEKYASTSRRVTHTFNLERSGLMEIKITVKPKRAKKLTYIMVFDRVTQDAQPT
ncbi:MAG: hypothetical protein OXG05_08180 [Gammaproteobacteria bacterium]|nr:hypothetical protein [Gammaproteobacteria bacterium]